MDSGKKLREAEYFLKTLQQISFNNRDELHYNLSAFLSAWRSILDIMLYDFAELYRIGQTRENNISDYEFDLVARATQNTRALDFIKWWRQKERSFHNERLKELKKSLF